MNFPSIHPDELQRLQPWIRLADQLGALASQMGTARIEALGVRYYGALVESRGVDVLAASAAAGVLRPILSSGVSIVNARAVARARGIDIVESRSSRSRHFTSLVSIKLQTDAGERWVEGTVFEPNSPRLVSVRGVNVEAPLGGTMLIIANDDQPGVIGEVGTILGRHGVNIANFALGRGDDGRHRRRQRGRRDRRASRARRRGGSVRKVPAIREAWVVRLAKPRTNSVTRFELRYHRDAQRAGMDANAKARARLPPARRPRERSSAGRFRWSRGRCGGSNSPARDPTVPLKQPRQLTERPPARPLLHHHEIEQPVVDARARRDARAVAELRGVGDRHEHRARRCGPAGRDRFERVSRLIGAERARPWRRIRQSPRRPAPRR